MEVLKRAVVFLSGVVTYLFLFTVVDYLLSGSKLFDSYLITSILILTAGFSLNIIINRYLYGFCIIRSVLYSFYSLVLLVITGILITLFEG
ncbi:hypothetical protein [Persephonella sp.]